MGGRSGALAQQHIPHPNLRHPAASKQAVAGPRSHGGDRGEAAQLAVGLLEVTHPTRRGEAPRVQEAAEVLKVPSPLHVWDLKNLSSWHTEAILPGLKNDTTIDICVAIDTSGSISNKMLKDFLSEINGIMSQYTDYKIYIWSFDTDVHNPVLFTPDKDINDYKPAGFGGTDFDANWKWMKEQGVEPKKLVVFTDGYPFGSWGDENYCDTLWVVHSNHDKSIQAPFGQTCIYEA